MSTKGSAVVVPTTSGGSADLKNAAAVTEMKGGALVLSPLPLGGGKRKKRGKKTKKVPKKILKLFKKGSAKKLRKMMKGGQDAMEEVTGESAENETGAEEGAGRKRRTRRGSRKSRRAHSFLY